MGKEVIFKTFRTYAHPYVYDRHTNSLVMLTDDEFKELREVETGNLPWEQSAVVQRYQSFGLMQPNVVEKIEHPATEIVEQYLTTRMRQLTLQVTQQCNLRCAYCAYSGIYEGNRTHSSKRMSFETAKKAIDFFLERTSSRGQITIGFYGGEPLLEFDLIKQCVAYVKEKVEGKHVLFNMTTNGTLLTDEIEDFLVKNDFSLMISLDGSEKEHDVNRRFRDGRGSFSTIIGNITHLCERYPKYSKKVSIATTVNPHSDLGCVLEYFSTEKVFSDKHIVFNSMKETLLDEAAEFSYDKHYYRIRNYEYIKALFAMVGKINESCVSTLAREHRSYIERKLKTMHGRFELGNAVHHSGPCIPGVQRLFVRTDGTLYPCERVNEDVDFFKIGNLDDGIDINKVIAILNIGQVTEENCRNCWNVTQCTMCGSEIEFTGDLTKEAKLKECPKHCTSGMFDLHEICVLNEFGFKPQEEKLIYECD